MSRRQILRLLLAMVAVSLPHRGRLFGPLLVMLATVPIGACSPKYADQSSIYPMQRDCVGLACPPLPEQVAVMKDAWDAFNNGYFDQATKKVDEVINTWGPKATEEQKNLCHHLNEPGFQVPHEGVVPAIEADRIRSFGLVNEVARLGG